MPLWSGPELLVPEMVVKEGEGGKGKKVEEERKRWRW